MSLPITARQKDVYEAICALVAKEGRAVTLREIARATGLSAISTIHVHVHGLEQAGLMVRSPLKGGWLVVPAGATEQNQGWDAALGFVRPRIEAAMAEHHADTTLAQAVLGILDDAAQATR